LVKAPDFDSGIRGFESFLPSHFPRRRTHTVVVVRAAPLVASRRA
jgi:hypothetical protein